MGFRAFDRWRAFDALRVPSGASAPGLISPEITTTTLDAMTYGEAFSQTLAATGTTPITWTVSAGTLPDGLNLSAAGELTGTPTASGNYDFTVQATNSIGNDTQQYTGTVAFTPLELFAASEQGAWYDPSDFSTLWQDAAGTTPVTATGQVVGRVDDKSGNANHLFQSTTAEKPVLRIDGNGKYYLDFDGTDDRLIGAAINLSATDEVTVCAGITKDSTTSGVPIANAQASISDGAFTFFWDTFGAGKLGVRARGTTASDAQSAANYPAGSTNVATSLIDISADSNILRADGAQIASVATDLGTGNFSSTLIIQLSNRGGSLPFNGRIYQAVVRGNLTSGAALVNLETYVADKTGVTLP